MSFSYALIAFLTFFLIFFPLFVETRALHSGPGWLLMVMPLPLPLACAYSKYTPHLTGAHLLEWMNLSDTIVQSPKLHIAPRGYVSHYMDLPLWDLVPEHPLFSRHSSVGAPV